MKHFSCELIEMLVYTELYSVIRLNEYTHVHMHSVFDDEHYIICALLVFI